MSELQFVNAKAFSLIFLACLRLNIQCSNLNPFIGIISTNTQSGEFMTTFRP